VVSLSNHERLAFLGTLLEPILITAESARDAESWHWFSLKPVIPAEAGIQ